MAHLRDHIDLLRLRASRDPDAFARIYDRYVDAIYRFVSFKLPSKEDAQDVTADVFMKAWDHIRQDKPVENVRAFLYQVARNAVVDRYRRNHAESRGGQTTAVTFSLLEASSVSDAIELGDEGRSADQAQAKAEVALLVRRLARLKDQYRDVLLLRLVDDLPFDAIASVMGVSAVNARVLYHRALKALKASETMS